MSRQRKKPSRDPRGVAAIPPLDDASQVMARLDTGVWVPARPPGIHVERYSFEDRRQANKSGNVEDKKTRILEVWTSERDRVIDAWLDAERWLRTAATLMLSPTEDMREQVWKLVYRQSGDYLIQLARDLLAANGHDTPDDFFPALSKLCKLRNLFAHQVSRPPHSAPPDGLTFLQTKEFKKGAYVTVSFRELEATLAAAKPIFAWLIAEIPEADGVAVQFEEGAFDSLMD